jgi:hypothetical protein
MSCRIAIGPQAGRKAQTLYRVPTVEEAPTHPLLARRAGFSLHAATVCEAWQRSRLERLCRCSSPATTSVTSRRGHHLTAVEACSVLLLWPLAVRRTAKG